MLEDKKDMRWIYVIGIMSNVLLLHVTGLCISRSPPCTSHCHCVDQSICANRGCVCQTGWSGHTCQRRNVVFGTKGSMIHRSSVADNSPQLYGTRAFDGNLDTVFSTENENNPFLMVTMNLPLLLYSMKIYNREDGSGGVKFADRIRGFLIHVNNGSTAGSSLCFQDDSQNVRLVYEINCTGVLFGKHVKITIPRQAILNIREFEIFECADYWFGYECGQSCNCNSTKEICNKITGSCDMSGCRPGYTGTDCYRECADYWFGYQCGQPCNCDSTTEVCNKITGSCGTSGCRLGYTGTDCYRGYFGKNCQSECHCLQPCNIITGLCTAGCVDGYKGINCRTECSDGSFGKNCEFTCHCQDSISCNKSSGTCSSGCAPGFKRNNCQLECSDGSFGGNCVFTCHCQDSIPCNKSSGTCTSGCAAGFTGNNCQLDCHDGYFGLNCQFPCRCLQSATCNGVSGACAVGCAAGYTGDDCQTECPDGSFGEGCRSTCHCLNTNECNKMNGSCAEDCTHGYKGLACQTECRNGYFGLDCNFTCRCYNANETCDKDTGKCTKSGCITGYTGIGCQTLAQSASTSDGRVVGPIVGGLVGFLVLVVAAIMFIIFTRRRRAKGRNSAGGTTRREEMVVHVVDPENGQENEETRFAEGGVDYVNVQSLATPSTRVCLRDLTAYLNQRLGEEKPFAKEFLNLPSGLLESCEEAKKPANVKKCRYKGMLPYDNTRVVLDVSNNDPYSDFMNANYVNGYTRNKAYIASQGTTSHNMVEFWRMVWKVQASEIVMLSGLVESGKTKVERYWPAYENTAKTYGDILVETMVIQNLLDCCIRTFKVQLKDEARTVKQFHFLDWPDHGIPSDTSGILVLRDRVKFSKGPQGGPIIVHCSAGVGRTGTYIGFDYLMDKLERENEVDIFQCVSELRHQRTQMVQTSDQYTFLHMLVNDGIQCRDSSFTTEELVALDINSDAFKKRIHDQYEKLQKFVHLPMRSRTAATADSHSLDEDLGEAYIPSNANRVLLSTRVPGRSDFINAVYVPVTKDGQELIVSENPTAEKVTDFWRMIHERKCTTIVMLSIDVQGSHVYWPIDNLPIRHGPFEISLLETGKSGSSVYRTFSCAHSNKKDESPRVVRQICLTDWKDGQGIPSGESILRVKESIEDWHSQIEPGHIVIHSRNGSDQTGLMCVALEILERIQTDQWVNMMIATKRVRTACPKAVISMKQYRFCYSLVKMYVEKFKTYADCS